MVKFVVDVHSHIQKVECTLESDLCVCLIEDIKCLIPKEELFDTYIEAFKSLPKFEQDLLIDAARMRLDRLVGNSKVVRRGTTLKPGIHVQVNGRNALVEKVHEDEVEVVFVGGIERDIFTIEEVIPFKWRGTI